MIAKIITRATAEPLTLDECRNHLEVQPYSFDSNGDGIHPDDALIMAMQSAAREYCEGFTGLSFVGKTYEIALDKFPAGKIELPHPPLVGVLSIDVGEESDSLMDPSGYVVDTYATPQTVGPYSSWPTLTASTNLVKIRYIAGYGDESDYEPMPYVARAAILLLLGHLYRNRESTAEKALMLIPHGVESLLRPLRIRMGMA